MGRELLIKKLKSKAKVFFICGGLLILLGIPFLLMVIADGMHPIIIVSIMLIGAGVAICIPGFDYIKGEDSKFIKKRPNILELADDLTNNLVYQDNFVIISKRAIAPKKDITSVAEINDALLIYESIQRMNGIVSSHLIKIELRNGKSLNINVYARKNDTKENLLLTISNYCPNAKVGCKCQ